ncbi:MAG: ribbon-helix-helix protein, CopG family [Proteobacteria bacterium]|nr:ribbon-helix-helix protein, CopG family [Actinomycetes bacterium]MCP4919481.1 ribbon-helix-helix protein, CopG family [Pseudomonadota bacterium]
MAKPADDPKSQRNWKRFQVALPPLMRARLRERARQKGLGESSIVRLAIADYLDKEDS